MKFIKPNYEILTPLNREEILKSIEVAGRTCYKSEDKITENSASKFVEMISGRGHLSVIEHKSMTVRFICDRGVSHELVRHRIASFSQESTRYCNYSKDKHDNQLTFIIPCFWSDSPKNINHSANHALLEKTLLDIEGRYLQMLKQGASPQEARYILPNGLKTEIVVTANMREWKEIFKQRCSPAAHPQMREIMIPLQKKMQAILPEIFGDR